MRLRLQRNVEAPDDRIGIVDGNWPDVGQSLDLGSAVKKKLSVLPCTKSPRSACYIPFLDLVVGHGQAKLLDSCLDGVPAGQARSKVDVAGKTEVRRVENLVGAGVVEDGLGVDAGLVGEGAEASDGIVEGDVDLDSLGDHVLDLLELVQLVLALDVLRGRDDHAGHQATERGDTVTLADTKDGGVDVGGTGLEGAIGIGNGAAGIVVEVRLDIARHDTTQGPDEVVDLPGGRAANGIGNTDAVDADLVDSLVQGEEIDEIRAEGVLAGDCARR